MKKTIAALLALASACSGAEIRYTVTQLVPNDPIIGDSAAQGINLYGDAVGSFYGPSGGSSHAFLYSSQSGFFDFGATGNRSVSGINYAGQISAYGIVEGSSYFHALRYTPGTGFLDLGTLGGRNSETHGINSSGQVVGFAEATDGNEHAFRYTDGVGMVDLGRLPGAAASDARGINDLGWVTGTSGNRAFLYQDGIGMIDIGPGSGWSINNAGIVAGEDSSLHPVIYLNGQMVPLGGIGSARGINNNNLVVGTADADNFMHGFVWSQQDGMQDLNSLIDPSTGWYIAVAAGINDNGQIVGWGFSPDRGGIATPFRLDPIPEPSTWVLLIVGSGVFWFLRCRRG